MNTKSFNEVCKLFEADDSIYIAGSSSEPRTFVQALSDNASSLPPLEIVHSFLPGVNPVKLADTTNQIAETAIFPRAAEKVQLVPASYYGYQQYLDQRKFDWVILQISPRDERGRHCLGPSVEFLPTVLQHSRRVVGIVNPNVPVIKGSHFIESSDIDILCESDEPLVSYDAGSVDEVSTMISQHLATLIEDGCTLQLGLGKVPTKLLDTLVDRRQLRFHTGLLTAGFFSLLEAGALDEQFKHTTCVSLGDAQFYQRLADIPELAIAGVEYTHEPSTLSSLRSMIAINSALQVDLSGQANLEYMGKRKISSAGGALDFAPAASNASEGKSIIALPATAAKGTVSRIQNKLDPTYPASLPSEQIDYVVTEFGVARLTGKSVKQKAEALASIAAPQFQASLLV